MSSSRCTWVSWFPSGPPPGARRSAGFLQVLLQVHVGQLVSLRSSSRCTWVSWFPLRSSSSTCPVRDTFQIQWNRVFYRMDVLPVIQPSLWKHWREHKSITLTSSCPQPLPNSRWKEYCSRYVGILITVPRSNISNMLRRQYQAMTYLFYSH